MHGGLVCALAVGAHNLCARKIRENAVELNKGSGPQDILHMLPAHGIDGVGKENACHTVILECLQGLYFGVETLKCLADEDVVSGLIEDVFRAADNVGEKLTVNAGDHYAHNPGLALP